MGVFREGGWGRWGGVSKHVWGIDLIDIVFPCPKFQFS